jgi:hypothetical protein
MVIVLILMTCVHIIVSSKSVIGVDRNHLSATGLTKRRWSKVWNTRTASIDAKTKFCDKCGRCWKDSVKMI